MDATFSSESKSITLESILFTNSVWASHDQRHTESSIVLTDGAYQGNDHGDQCGCFQK